MTDDNKFTNVNDVNFKQRTEATREEKLEKAARSMEQVRLSKKVKELSGDSEWTILEQLLQEIDATAMARNEKPLSAEKAVTQLIQEISLRYEDEPEIMQILLDGIPSKTSISNWRASKGWTEALWGKVRLTGLFTGPKRAQIIQSLFAQAAEGNTAAAKLWLTLSGDYSEKSEVTTNATHDAFREINNIIHNKNK